MKTAEFSRTCKGCEYVREVPWPVKGNYREETVAFRCFANGPQKGRVVGIGIFEPYIPAWCPKMEWDKEVV